MAPPPVAPLFPVGGPVPADLMIGREDDDHAVSEFDVGLGLDQARQHLQDDDV
jgi:hypothetical protein